MGSLRHKGRDGFESGMAVANSLYETNAHADSVSESIAPASLAFVRLAVHDASRLEWSVSLPLPDHETFAYNITVNIRIPANAFAQHEPWDQLQEFTRMDGPALSAAHSDVMSIDGLRRGALAFAGRLAKMSDGFARHCRTNAHDLINPSNDFRERLRACVDNAVSLAVEARHRLGTHKVDDLQELARERDLVDEYISVRLLEMLAGAERGLTSLSVLPRLVRFTEDGIPESTRAPFSVRSAERVAVEAELVRDMGDYLANVLGAELEYRAKRGYVRADPSRPEALERYLNRASDLKKHFQEVLFLERESYEIAERAYHWVAAFVALLASVWAFAWQIALIRQGASDKGITSGLFTVALVAGIVYATKDRFKEIGRTWINNRMQRFYGAERITKYRAPARRLPGRDVIATAREAFVQKLVLMPDTLNPESGATTPFTTLTYTHRGTIEPAPALRAAGVRRVKHVFRYDLSPIFARLDDAVKPVPVLDDASHRVRFIDAPRCYHVPVTVDVNTGAQGQNESVVLIVHKRGLERIERTDASDPNLEGAGLEPG